MSSAAEQWSPMCTPQQTYATVTEQTSRPGCRRAHGTTWTRAGARRKGGRRPGRKLPGGTAGGGSSCGRQLPCVPAGGGRGDTRSGTPQGAWHRRGAVWGAEAPGGGRVGRAAAQRMRVDERLAGPWRSPAAEGSCAPVTRHASLATAPRPRSKPAVTFQVLRERTWARRSQHTHSISVVWPTACAAARRATRLALPSASSRPCDTRGSRTWLTPCPPTDTAPLHACSCVPYRRTSPLWLRAAGEPWRPPALRSPRYMSGYIGGAGTRIASLAASRGLLRHPLLLLLRQPPPPASPRPPPQAHPTSHTLAHGSRAAAAAATTTPTTMFSRSPPSASGSPVPVPDDPYSIEHAAPRAPLYKRIFKVGKLGAVFASGSALFSDGYVNAVSGATNTIIKVRLFARAP